MTTNFVTNLPRLLPNRRYAASNAGHVFSKNLPIASTFSLLSLSVNQSTNFTTTLPSMTVLIKSNTFSNNPLTGARTLLTPFAIPANTLDSKRFSFCPLACLSADCLSFLDWSASNSFFSIRVSRIDVTIFRISSKILPPAAVSGATLLTCIADVGLLINAPPRPSPGNDPAILDTDADCFFSNTLSTKF